jgi:hypothetical protein
MLNKLTVLPDFSLHEELKNFVEAGLRLYEAIRAGTSDAAIFLHQENEFAVVATGRRRTYCCWKPILSTTSKMCRNEWV